MYGFKLTVDEWKKVKEWSDQQDEVVLARQRERGEMGNRPNYGSIGGSLTYSFTPTSLGTVVKVEHGVTKAVLDLTDYGDW